tara:strand:+ start:619 stop:789 length:171 start_codon:yes stop_codon:yes gene_type:complete
MKKAVIIKSLETGKETEFESFTDACKEFGFKMCGITGCTQGMFKQHHGYSFKLKKQ